MNIEDLLNAADVTESIYSLLTKPPIDISAKSEPAAAFSKKGKGQGIEEWILDSSDKENRDLNLNYHKKELDYSAHSLTACNPRLQRLSSSSSALWKSGVVKEAFQPTPNIKDHIIPVSLPLSKEAQLEINFRAKGDNCVECDYPFRKRAVLRKTKCVCCLESICADCSINQTIFCYTVNASFATLVFARDRRCLIKCSRCASMTDPHIAKNMIPMIRKASNLAATTIIWHIVMIVSNMREVVERSFDDTISWRVFLIKCAPFLPISWQEME